MNGERVILGRDCIYENNRRINGNVIVCGSSGCGKTMSVLEPRLLETFHTSLIITVSKRRLVKQYTSLFLSRGYEVEELNFVHPTRSNVAYDPLAYVKNTTDIVYLAKAIIMLESKKEKALTDPYWDQCAASLLTAEIGYVLTQKMKPTFTDVLKLHDELRITVEDERVKTTLDGCFEKLEYEKERWGAFGRFIVNAWRTFRQVPMKTAACIYSTLNATLDAVFTPELRNMMLKSVKVDFEKLATCKTVLFVSTSAVNPALNQFVNLFYSQAIKQLFEFAEGCRNGRLPIPVHMLCDDFACGSRILNFPEYISIFREKGISSTLLLQSESQLEAMYGGDATTIINNCDTYVYMGGMDLATCKNISERLNWPLDDVLYMPLEQLVVFRRGQRPVVTERYHIQEDKRYQELMANNRRQQAKENVAIPKINFK